MQLLRSAPIIFPGNLRSTPRPQRTSLNSPFLLTFLLPTLLALLLSHLLCSSSSQAQLLLIPPPSSSAQADTLIKTRFKVMFVENAGVEHICQNSSAF